MNKLIIFSIVINLIGCAEATDIAPPFQFSTQEELVPLVQDSFDYINQAVGCDIVELVEDDLYAVPIVLVEEHSYGPGILGCAEIGGSLTLDKYENSIIISRKIFELIEFGKSIIVHEVGHSLGLAHIEEDKTGVMNPYASEYYKFNYESILYLRALCE